jgi:hypothetical protein
MKKSVWNEAKQKFIYPGQGRPRGNNANIARWTQRLEFLADELKLNEQSLSDTLDALKKAHSCRACRDRFIYNKELDKYELRRSERLRIPEYQAKLAALKQGNAAMQQELENVSIALAGQRMIAADEHIDSFLKCNDPAKVERLARAAAKKAGSYFQAGRKVEANEIY